MFGDLSKELRKQAVKTICQDPKIKNMYVSFEPITDGTGELLILVRVEDRKKNTTKEIPLVQGASYSIEQIAILAIELITKGDQ